MKGPEPVNDRKADTVPCTVQWCDATEHHPDTRGGIHHYREIAVFPGTDGSVIDLTVVHVEHPARPGLVFPHLSLSKTYRSMSSQVDMVAPDARLWADVWTALLDSDPVRFALALTRAAQILEGEAEL